MESVDAVNDEAEDFYAILGVVRVHLEFCLRLVSKLLADGVALEQSCCSRGIETMALNASRLFLFPCSRPCTTGYLRAYRTTFCIQWLTWMSGLEQSPSANEREIKQAYYRIMRACHPDVVGSLDDEEEEDDAAEVCVFVNDIYEVSWLRSPWNYARASLNSIH
jgi:hypothetical protein